MTPRRGQALSYVKVEVRGRSPRLWCWTLRHGGSDNLLVRSEGAYGCAEDAWTAGRLAHARYEAEAARSLLAAEEEPAEDEAELA